MLPIVKIISRNGVKYTLHLSRFILGEEIKVFIGREVKRCKLIKTSLKGYNILLIDENACLFPSAMIPNKYYSHDKDKGIYLLHSRLYIFSN